jgi:glycosyltransferase involved in cell wall biosynthesis
MMNRPDPNLHAADAVLAPPGEAVLRAGLLTVIIPANNEERLISPCLDALLASDRTPYEVEIIVVANGCTDGTVAAARAFAAAAHERGWGLTVLDLGKGDKLNALNAGDRIARGAMRAYLDADVIVSPPLLAQLCVTLDRPEPVYASGTLRIVAPGGRIARSYARMWAKVPFMRAGVPGCGLFAVNGPGRARWGAFPDIISDDTFVRLQFTAAERTAVPAPYDWPIAGDFTALVRVRRRQDRGVQDIAARFPGLMANEDKRAPGLWGTIGLALRDPVGFAVYAAVALAVRTGHGNAADSREWSRGR